MTSYVCRRVVILALAVRGVLSLVAAADAVCQQTLRPAVPDTALSRPVPRTCLAASVADVSSTRVVCRLRAPDQPPAPAHDAPRTLLPTCEA